MKLAALTLVAEVLTGVTSANPLVPQAIAPNGVPIQSMNFEDRFSNSGGDYLTWATKMVDAGKMYWAPTNTTSSDDHTIQERAGTSYSLTRVACGYLAGRDMEYSEGVKKVCNLIHEYATVVLHQAEYILTDGLCEDGETCTLFIEIAMGLAGGFVHDGIPAVCPQIFEAINKDCGPNSGGGSATLTIRDSKGTQTGTVTGQFHSYDSGATCAANTRKAVCKKERFN